jgi:ribosomal-protein-alanine N-acetyltransferase
MANFYFTPFPHLETERLHLGQLSLNNENEIFLLRSDKEVNKYLDRPRATSIEDARKFIQKINAGIENNESLFWAIHLKDKTGLIGTVCLWNLSLEGERAELGYELLPQHQGKGYMQEAIARVVEYGFKTMQLKTIEAWLRADNNRSIKLLEKNKFKRDKNAEVRMNAEERELGLTVYSQTNPKYFPGL